MNMVRTIAILLGALLLSAAPAAQANAPNEVIEQAVVLLSEGLNTRRDELAADTEGREVFTIAAHCA